MIRKCLHFAFCGVIIEYGNVVMESGPSGPLFHVVSGVLQDNAYSSFSECPVAVREQDIIRGFRDGKKRNIRAGGNRACT